MTKPKIGKNITVVFALCAFAILSQGQDFQTLVDFSEAFGWSPMYMTLVQSSDGNLYGTTTERGNGQGGAVFKVTIAGELTTVHNFCSLSKCLDGSFPLSGLTLASDGSLYGTTFEGGLDACRFLGCGTIYRVTPDGAFTTIYRFHGWDGYQPDTKLLEATDGNLYGATNAGGVYGGGTIFRITKTGTLTTLFNFYPFFASGTLVEGPDGDLYAPAGAGYFQSQIIKISRAGELSVLYHFCSQPGCMDGEGPQGLVLANDGNFYGTTIFGGVGCQGYQAGGCGTIFRITPTGTLTTLHRFCEGQLVCADGATPYAGLIQATDGSFYGTTSAGGRYNNLCGSQTGGCGTIFKITSTGTLTTLHRFTALNDGDVPTGGLLQATDGNFYGTTKNGGLDNFGTIFRLSTGLSPFVASVIPAGKIGQTGGILGQGLTGTTSVMFNGVPANFTIVSDTFIKATVPPGATTGYVTVTTPTGVLKSNVPFQVIP